MNKLSLSVCLAFAFFVASAVAQTESGGAQGGTQNSSTTTSQPSQGTSQTTADQNPTTQNQANAETIKGCVQSQGGSYVLKTGKRIFVSLKGEDISAHLGQKVELMGTWEGKQHLMSSTEAGGMKTFNVSGVKTISETCKDKDKDKDNTGSSSSPSGANPSTSPSGNSTQPQQPPQ